MRETRSQIGARNYEEGATPIYVVWAIYVSFSKYEIKL